MLDLKKLVLNYSCCCDRTQLSPLGENISLCNHEADLCALDNLQDKDKSRVPLFFEVPLYTLTSGTSPVAQEL
jgi:hypothetical protein